MVQQSNVLKQLLAGIYSNHILHLNSVSESEKTEDSKKIILLEILLQNLQIFVSFCVEITTILFPVHKTIKNRLLLVLPRAHNERRKREGGRSVKRPCT